MTHKCIWFNIFVSYSLVFSQSRWIILFKDELYLEYLSPNHQAKKRHEDAYKAMCDEFTVVSYPAQKMFAVVYNFKPLYSTDFEGSVGYAF